MQYRSLLRGLLAAGLSATLTPPALHARGFRLRSEVRTEAQVLEAVERGDETVRVLVVARESRGSADLHVLGAGPTIQRRAAADRSTRAIRDILSGGDGGIGIHSAPVAEYTYLWAANAIAAEVDPATLEKLRSEPSVDRIVLDRIVDWLAIDADPAPPAEDDGDAASPSNYGLGIIGADRAASERGLTGEGVTVGHIDTGVQGDHPALSGKVVAFKDFINGNDETPYDDQGHGTHSAGTIAADGVGVAPGAQLVVAKALDHRGSGSRSGLLGATQWMLDPDGDPSTDDQPDLVSNSWGASKRALGDGAEMFRDVVKAWRQAGIVPVFASGNSGLGSQAVPGGYPEAFAVGATDEDDQVARFSTGGPIEWNGETFLKPDVSAPGVDIVSTMPDGGYQPMSGTSMACPHMAGALALLLQANPGMSVDQLQSTFEETSKDLGEAGRDARYGEGRIDVMAAISAGATQLVSVRIASSWLN